MSLVTLLKKIGVDKSIAYSSGSRIIAAISGLVTIFFIAKCLTKEEQGFYFTFGSLLALQVFFELGLTSVMTQYVAHEVAHLTREENGKFSGEHKYLSRLASLLKFCVKWYSILGIIVFFFLLSLGSIFFSKYTTTDIIWVGPWLVVCIATSIKLFQSPISSVLMGIGYVKENSKIIFFQSLFQPFVIWIMLSSGFKLYSIGIGYIVSCIIWFVMLLNLQLYKPLITLWGIKIIEKVKYFEEIFPFQWKIALSWISGYFIYQLFNPVLFATEGAIVAGQMGMTISVLSSIQSFSNSWIYTKVPLYSQLVAKKEFHNLDISFNTTNLQMSIVCIVLLLGFNIFVILLRVTGLEYNEQYLAERFLPIIPMILMSGAIFSNIWLTSWGIYLRSHKKEPLLIFSIVLGLMCCCSTIVLGYIWGLNGITIGYFLIMTLSVPWAHSIFKKCKEKWHQE